MQIRPNLLRFPDPIDPPAGDPGPDPAPDPKDPSEKGSETLPAAPVPAPAPSPSGAPPQAAQTVLDGKVTEREAKLAKTLKARETRLAELEDENQQLRKIPT